MIETVTLLPDDVLPWRERETDWPPREDENPDPGPGQGIPTHERTSDHLYAAQLDSSEIALWRDRLASATMPREEGALIDLLREAEDLKSTAAAIQARSAVAFEAARRQAEADRSVPSSKRGVGVSAEVGLARRESPHRGSHLLGLAKALVHELPHTLRALTDGTLNEWRATLITRETACLDPSNRAIVDAWLEGHLADNPTVGDKRLIAEVRRKVIEIDQTAVLRRRAAAGGDRRVTMRPLPDGLVRVTATLELREGVAVFAALKKAADGAAGTSDATGKPRGRGAVMADTLVERVTGNPASNPIGLDLTVVITDQALLSENDEPAHVDGYGPMPASWVRRIIRETTDPAQRIAIRRLFRGPGRLVKLETASRLMTAALRHLIIIRDQLCRTPWCGAPIRQADHVQAHADGGPTSLLNGQGLCEACNYTKQQPGWRSTPRQDPTRGHVVTLTTPTGHTYESTQPTGPGEG